MTVSNPGNEKILVGTGIADRMRRPSLARDLLAVIAGTLFLAICAQIKVPMIPVPMTMGTFGIVVVALTMGWRLGGLTVLTYLAQGAVGLPVFASAGAGLAYFAGPTAGYLLGYAIAVPLAGWIAARGPKQLTLPLAVIVAQLAIFVPGVGWLAIGPLAMGWDAALAAGALPFMLGEVLKMTLAVTCILGWQRLARRS